jgi:hypothetical protein
VKTDEEWTKRVNRETTAAPPPWCHPNAVRSAAGSPLTGLARLQAELCRALGRVHPRPSALPDGLLP